MGALDARPTIIDTLSTIPARNGKHSILSINFLSDMHLAVIQALLEVFLNV